METSPLGMMGYDRAITVFSPDGRLLQVEYARQTVSQGTTAIGIVCKEGAVLVTDKRIIDTLVVPETSEKISKIDSHIGATMSGLVSDGRVLLEKARTIAQNHKITYDEPVDLLTLTKEISDHKQVFTQWGGARPFGVSLLFAGVDSTGAHLMMTEPSGIFFEYKATAIGEGSVGAVKFLEKNYKENMTIDQAIILGLTAIKKVLEKNFSTKRIEAATVLLKTKEFKKFSQQEIENYIKKM